MYAGIDFGTSNCAIGVWENDSPCLINLTNNGPLMASTLYASKVYTEEADVDQYELERRVSGEKRDERKRKDAFVVNEQRRKVQFLAEQKKRKEKSVSDNIPFIEVPFVETIFYASSDEAMANRALATLRRESIERSIVQYERYTLTDILSGTDYLVFGEEAINNHVLYPKSGHFIKSPKSFLGANIASHHISAFTLIVSEMLQNIKTIAERNTGKDIDNIVLGKPVNFHGSSERNGNEQALNIMRAAAERAGYKQVEFMYEPIAAALDYERTATKDHVVLVIDAGGGTTDFSLVQVGPSFKDATNRDETILGYAGERVGGTDIDIALAKEVIMPLFGKDTFMRSLSGKPLPLPYSIFSDAVSINDVQAQNTFSSDAMGRKLESLLSDASEPEKLKRLQFLHENGLSYRLVRSSESAKIQLSENNLIDVPLDYIEQGLQTDITRENLKESMERILDKFSRLIGEVKAQSQVQPDVIYVTGGTAKSPIISDWIRSHYGDIEIVSGDSFGSVTSGLTTWAHQLFK